MSYVFAINYRSNKPTSYQQFDAASMEDAKAQAGRMLESSIDVSEVCVYEYVNAAQKVEVVQWNY